MNTESWESMKDFVDQHGVLTDSLWILGERDDSGAHGELHHGGFIPQLPRQAILRFTHPYETIIDCFTGYGTTLIECRRWGRHGFGVELDQKIHRIAQSRIDKEPNRFGIKTVLVRGNSASVDIRGQLEEEGLGEASLAVLHPPYHDIIKYGGDEENLCNASSLDDFHKRYGEVVKNVGRALKPGGYLELIIGDKYSNGEWVPLGFQLMEETVKRGFKLKSICVKNIENTMAKRSQIHLWRYRALKSGFYFFKHEYVMFFKK